MYTLVYSLYQGYQIISKPKFFLDQNPDFVTLYEFDVKELEAVKKVYRNLSILKDTSPAEAVA